MKQRFALLQRVDFIKEQCRGKTVLHLGCTNYPYTQDAIDKNMLLHFDLEKCSDELYGFDFDQPGIDILLNAGSTNIFQADLENLDAVPLDKTFDLIIAGEMIEHLSNVGLFLSGIKRFMSSETKLIVTTVNAYCAMRFIIYTLRGMGGRNEPVHPDHVSYYSYKTLKLILDRHDFQLDQFYFYDLGNEHRRFVPFYYRWFNDLSVTVSKQLADGVIAVAALKSTTDIGGE